jgi:hypothetical protein
MYTRNIKPIKCCRSRKVLAHVRFSIRKPGMIIELFVTVVPDSVFSGYRPKNQSVKLLFEDPSTKHVKLFALS